MDKRKVRWPFKRVMFSIMIVMRQLLSGGCHILLRYNAEIETMRYQKVETKKSTREGFWRYNWNFLKK